MVEKVKITYQGKSKMVPKNYVEGLKGNDRRKQIKSIFEGTFRPQTKFKSKPSSWTEKFNKKYGKEIDKMKGGRSKRNIAKITGIPSKQLMKYLKKAKEHIILLVLVPIKHHNHGHMLVFIPIY